eukprot:TRINITY_DN6112_c0_g1_i2.p1 TRINITY_DN6112_c0_g1~~TRINITY_DN6112_c0_g1_i2.p1  ORF type:complete len:121 (+),score=40.41 TRINITY_DN6112_c0_g1_i2:147-509(+)
MRNGQAHRLICDLQVEEEPETIESDKSIKRKKSGKKNKAGNQEVFRRVKAEEIEVLPQLADNSYEAAFGQDGWGAKASKDLMVTRGKSFRHEKTKKKRGSYRGGQIDTNKVNSFKFGDDW